MVDIVKDIVPAVEIAGHLVTSKEYEAVDLEIDQERPRRKRGERRFTTADGFCAYVKRHKTADSSAYADASAAMIRAVLNDHGEQPGHGDHVAVLTLARHRDRVAWEAAAQTTLDQNALIDLIDEQVHCIAEPAAADLAEMLTTLKLAKNTRLESVRDLRTGNIRVTLTEEETGATSQADIPGRIKLALRIFECSTERRVVEAKLGWRMGQDKRVQFKLKLLDLDDAVDAELDAVSNKITALTDLEIWR